MNRLEKTEWMQYKDAAFEIMMTEKGSLLDPWELGLLPVEKKKNEMTVIGNYQIEDFVLYLEAFEARDGAGSLVAKKEGLHIPLAYSGSVLLVRELIEQYAEYKPCYGYQELFELIFDRGCLTTNIDHSRAMYRIRRNLETGLRDMSNPKDARCILHFIDRLFVGKYKESLRARYFHSVKLGLKKLWKKLKKWTCMGKALIFRIL